MRIIRFVEKKKIKYGIQSGNTVKGLSRTPFSSFRGAHSSFSFDGSRYSLNELRLLAPCLPSKIVGIGLNYRSHSKEFQTPPPSEPLIFIKPATAVIGPEDKIILPSSSQSVDYEGELGVVIGKRAKNVTRNKAKDYILGYVCVNDVTSRIIQQKDGQWTRAKSFDTFAPVGPCIQTDMNPENINLETYLNGELRQSVNTSDLIFGVTELIEFVSGVMTLLPGDIISTGTPAGVGSMKPGDIIEVKINKIGILKNFVVSDSAN